MKKKVLVVMMCVTIFVLFVAIYFRPIPIVSPRSVTTIHVVNYNWEEVTDKVNHEEIIEILEKYYTRRSINDAFPSLVEDEVWDIRFMRESGAMNLSLGNTNVLYRCASDTIIHRVIDAESLIDELREIMYY